ncbi:MAG: LPXTG cell wall anchor domain-containing protein [Clostridia bacterium]|nr:LPXTG cell wall anchor domain-containing protein [Clostridia bacterium]
MKKFKISLTAIVAAIILSISTGVFAYTGVGDVDPEFKFTMPSSLSNGEGTVSGVSGTMNYQFVEITSEKYTSIKKLEAQYDMIEVYVRYAENPTDEGLIKEWENAGNKYTNQYGGTATDVLNQYGVGPDILTLCRNAWIVELTNFDASKWISSSDNKISIDISTFEGTKYYIAWIQVGDTYDAEAYMVTGTKQEEQIEDKQEEQIEDKKEEQIEDKKEEQIEDKQEETKSETAGNEVKNETKTNNLKTDTTTVSSKTLPKTGANGSILGLLVIAVIATGVSYIKYRKIK